MDLQVHLGPFVNSWFQTSRLELCQGALWVPWTQLLRTTGLIIFIQMCSFVILQLMPFWEYLAVFLLSRSGKCMLLCISRLYPIYSIVHFGKRRKRKKKRNVLVIHPSLALIEVAQFSMYEILKPPALVSLFKWIHVFIRRCAYTVVPRLSEEWFTPFILPSLFCLA